MEDRVDLDLLRGRVTRTERSSCSTAVVRVWMDDGRSGTATGTLESGDLVDRALEAAAVGAPCRWAGPTTRLGFLTGLGIEDRRYDAITDEDRVDSLSVAERAVRTADRRARSEGFAYQDRRVRRQYASSRGIQAEETSTLFRATGTVAVDDDHGRVIVEDGIWSRSFSSIASLPFGSDLAVRAGELVGPEPAEPANLRAILPSRTCAWLFAELAKTFTVASIAAGACPLTDRPASSQLSLLDDGCQPGSLGTRMFDDEGVPPSPVPLLREGRVNGRYVDVETARAMDLRPSGHRLDGAFVPSNLIVRPGSRPVSAIVADSDVPVFVVDHATDASLVDGQLSARLHGAIWRRGRREAALRDRLVRGDVGDVLSHIVEIAADAERIGAVDSPPIVVDGLRFS